MESRELERDLIVTSKNLDKFKSNAKLEDVDIMDILVDLLHLKLQYRSEFGEEARFIFMDTELNDMMRTYQYDNPGDYRQYYAEMHSMIVVTVDNLSLPYYITHNI